MGPPGPKGEKVHLIYFMCVYFCAVFLVFQSVFLVFGSALVCNWSQSDKSISVHHTVCKMSNIIYTHVLSVG